MAACGAGLGFPGQALGVVGAGAEGRHSSEGYLGGGQVSIGGAPVYGRGWRRKRLILKHSFYFVLLKNEEKFGMKVVVFADIMIQVYLKN